jgi:hypothetical protein
MKYQFEPFYVEYEPITSPVGDFKTECILAAHKAVLANKGNLPIVVMMSGGIDSELVAESLLLAKIPFRCVIGKLMTEVIDDSIIFNQHDYQYAERWCNRNNIEVIYCELDIFKQNKLLCEYALSAQGFSPQYGCHMYIMKWCSDQGYFFLAGNGEMDIVLKDGHYFMMDEQREFTLANFCESHKLNGIFQFWRQDARLIASFLKLPTVQQLIAQNTESLLKHKHKCFADVFQFEPRCKTTGFERVQEWDYPLRTHLKQFKGQFDSKYYTPIEHFKEI